MFFVLVVIVCVDSDVVCFREVGFVGCLYKFFFGDELMVVIWGVECFDFIFVMEGEEYVDELLDIFIEDMEVGFVGICDVVSLGDYKKFGNIIYKVVFVWEMIWIDIFL